MPQQQMNQQSIKRVCVIFFQRASIGVSYFSSQTLRVQCSSISNICCISNQLLLRLFVRPVKILTNNPSHQIFMNMDESRVRMMAVSDKPLDFEAVEQNLLAISSHVSKIKNSRAYFRKMAENEVKFSALGILLQEILGFIQKKIFLEDVQYFSDTIFELVNIGKSQLQFLQITRQDIHPSLVKGKGQSKEGYSLLSAFQAYLFSTGSKKILRYLMLNPTYNMKQLEKRQNIIEWMRINLHDTKKYAQIFKNISFLETTLKKFGRMSAEEDDWRKIMKTLQAMIGLIPMLRQVNPPQTIIQYTENDQWNDIVEIFSVLRQTFEFNPFRVRSGIDQTLDQLKHTYDQMPHFLTLLAKQQQWDLDFRIVFMTQIGYLVRVQGDLPENIASEEWELQFKNGTGLYFSNSVTQALDEQYGDIFGQIQDIEKKVSFEMETLVVSRSQSISNLYWKLCEIECFWGVSQACNHMCKPRLSRQALLLAHSWHPLLPPNSIKNHCCSFPQSQAPRQQVFNSERNLLNMNYSNRCSIITGPNASGKTVYMKQIALLIYLAHLGFFVPAALAEVPLIDSIICVGKTDSIYRDQHCGFDHQLASLSSITQPFVMSCKSLVLIDQLGSQIDYQNSLKMLYASVQYLSSKQIKFPPNRLLSSPKDEFKCPLVIMVTHLSQIINSKAIQQNYHVRFLTMTVEQDGLFLYKIKPGIVSKGYGLRSASTILPNTFINLSEKYLRLISSL